MDDAEHLSQRALLAGQQAEAGNAIQFYSAMIFHLRRAQGRLTEIAPMAQELSDRFPALQVWRAGLALPHVELGQDAQARGEFAGLPTPPSVPVPISCAASVSPCFTTSRAHIRSSSRASIQRWVPESDR